MSGMYVCNNESPRTLGQDSSVAPSERQERFQGISNTLCIFQF